VVAATTAIATANLRPIYLEVTAALWAFLLVASGGVTHARNQDIIAMLDNIGGKWGLGGPSQVVVAA
jgi:hypothetical protein